MLLDWVLIATGSSLCYYRSVDALAQESGVSLDKFDVADNIDLTQILQVWRTALVKHQIGQKGST